MKVGNYIHVLKVITIMEKITYQLKSRKSLKVTHVALNSFAMNSRQMIHDALFVCKIFITFGTSFVHVDSMKKYVIRILGRKVALRTFTF